MKVKEFTKDYILFDNNKYLTFKITNSLKYDLYDYYFDFEEFYNQLKDDEIDENTLKFDKYIVQLAFLSTDEIHEDEIHYTYNPYTSTFDKKSYADERNIGILLSFEITKLIEYDTSGKKIQYPRKVTITKEYFIPFYRKEKSLNNQKIEELQNQILDIEKNTNKYLNTKYSFEDKIAAEVNIQILYDNQQILKMCGFDAIELPGNYIHSEKEIYYDESKAFTILTVNEESIEFSNGKKLTFDHMEDCYEYNYADFTQIDDLALDMTFYENELVFEAVKECGIRFGNRGGNMVFIPCYSDQNGYYTTSVDIYYDNKLVLHLHESELQYYGIPNEK